ncbi:MAG: hypothetical protein PHV74_16085 [Dehalococcoidia bacterium]|nr:hypothetical protein [Dehalococcoidia bacterium]
MIEDVLLGGTSVRIDPGGFLRTVAQQKLPDEPTTAERTQKAPDRLAATGWLTSGW